MPTSSTWAPETERPGATSIGAGRRATHGLGSFSTGNSPPPLEPSDPARNQEAWRTPSDIRATDTLSIGRNLVFAGWNDGRLSAYDAATGEVLWEGEIGPSPVAPITYAVNG